MERKFTEGDYAYSSYGYDQTNISFYKVVKTTADFVTLAPVAQNRIESGEGFYGYTTPDTTSEPRIDKKFRRKIHRYDFSPGESAAYATSYGIIYPYEGKPVSYTWGH